MNPVSYPSSSSFAAAAAKVLNRHSLARLVMEDRDESVKGTGVVLCQKDTLDSG